jgi:heterodisulfide reductase subunit A-like polyferredoxin/coenzyme F420-reducing hydrogenase delta subunit
MEAALGVANQGYQAYLVERSDKLGGVALQLHHTWQNEDIGKYVKDLIRKVQSHERVKLFMNAEVAETTGIIGSFTTTIAGKDMPKTAVDHGATILATGGKEYKPTEYLYGQHPAVMTHLESDAAIGKQDVAVKNAKNIVFIQCVGSRTPERPYCSRVCCTHSIMTAIAFKKENPDRNIFILYRDIRTYAFREDLYTEARGLGILFIQYNLDHLPEVVMDDQKRLSVTVTDHILKMPVQISADLLVLASAILPNENRHLFEAFKVPINSEGFLVEAHAKLRPVDFASEGLFMAGLGHFPKPIDETIAQARAAVSRTMTIVSKEFIKVGGVVAKVMDTSLCAACLVCVRSCPYGVPKIVDGRSVIEPAECHGCGVCVAACPAKAIKLQHFTDDQILAKIHALFEDMPAPSPTGEFEPKILAICCKYCAYAAADLAGSMRLSYPGNIKIIQVPCTGRVDVIHLLKAFGDGADGVCVAGCLEGECHFISGNLKAKDRVKYVKDALARVGIEPERVEMFNLSSAMGVRFAEIATEMAERIRKLGPSPLNKN